MRLIHQMDIDIFLIRGFRPCDPDLLFVLTQKVSKKVKTAPVSLEKLTFSWLKLSKLAPSSLKQDSFKRQLHLFFGSPDEVDPCAMQSITRCMTAQSSTCES